MRRSVIILALAAVSVAGCASLPQGFRPAREPANLGQRFLERACAGCHAVGPAGESPNVQAPPFRTLAALPGRTLEADLAAISERGHVQMPPIYMTPGEIRAVAAYVRSLSLSGT